MKRKIITIIGLVIFLMPFMVSAQNSPWAVISGYIKAVVPTWGLQVPSLASPDNPCVVIGSDGKFATSTCGGVASLTGGSPNTLTYWTSATAVGATSSPTVGYIWATSTSPSYFEKVGVGSTSPSYPLVIVGNSDGIARGPLYIQSTPAGTLGAGFNLDASASGGKNYSIFSGGSASFLTGGWAVYSSTDAAYRLSINAAGSTTVGIVPGDELTAGSQLGVNGNTSIGGTYYRLAAPTNGLIVEGDVGIGDSTPSYDLDVAGTGRFTTSVISDILQSNTDSDVVIDLGPAENTIDIHPGYSSGDHYFVLYSESDDANNPQLIPSMDNSGQIGTAGNTWNIVRSNRFIADSGTSTFAGGVDMATASGCIASNGNCINREKITLHLDGGGLALSTGTSTASVRKNTRGTITGWTVDSDDGTSGSIAIDVWIGDVSLVGAGTKPNITTSTTGSGGVSDWSTTTFNAGDRFKFNVTSAMSVKYVTMTLYYTI